MAEIAMMKTQAETALADLFARSKSLLPGDARSREDAFHRFAVKGLPHRRVEEWKYTDLRALMREVAPLAAKPDAAAIEAALAVESVFAAAEPATIAFVNGHLAKADAMPDGVAAVSLAQALAEGHPLLSKLGAVSDAEGNAAYALNAAFMTDGVVLHVTKRVEGRVALRFVTTGASAVSTATRVLVVVEEDAAISLLETHESANGLAHQPNDVVEFVVGDRAEVAHVRLNAESDAALALSTVTAHLGAQAAFGSRNIVAGSGLSRHQVWMTFAGADTKGAVRGATMLGGSQHADTTLVVNHLATGCESRELFKTAIDGRATGVFQGRINVAPQAQKTDGKMMSAAVLLSEEGTMMNKPELEIFADDVQCAHGATCGELDDDLLFYLMARGLPRPEAEALLIESFLGEAVEEDLDDAIVGEALMGIVEAWLKKRG
ncbi:Fe-S cluster assembly protein SufD [Salinarimonas ramus]|uniref:Fe-S cluster assembly protein SufD n=1 Tax=Salinarimonas ramus TaxID=690164 RepID=A0A917Q4N1_9HYPH|nr:Fe-S cluster assembly protein SufD [Salinarimonas ramus]GGK21628.1 Fe-S cluster assembly protein SufD [Salinarimonas ramus]